MAGRCVCADCSPPMRSILASTTVLSELRTLDPATRPIPLIVCSAAIRDLQEHEGLLRRYDIDVLPKPFDVDALLEKVQANLSRGDRS